MAPVKTGTGKEAGKRFSNTEWEALQHILANGEGGKFRQMIHDKSVSSNMVKADMWIQITEMFNEVRWVGGGQQVPYLSVFLCNLTSKC
jgi:hypothetical protein